MTNPPIVAASTTTAAFIGRTHRGPMYGTTDTLTPPPLASLADFERIYGGFDAIGGTPNYLALAARAFFESGGVKLYVSRIADLPDSSTGAAGAATPGRAPTVAAYQRALSALERLGDVSTVAAPDAAAFPAILGAVNAALVAHAERPGAFRFALLDTAAGLSPAQAQLAKGAVDSSYAAMYYPWVVVGSPAPPTSLGAQRTTAAIPPSGFIAGVFARVALSRGIAKAPANEALQGAMELERTLSDVESNALSAAAINPLRSFAGRALLVWGARTTSSNSEWKYVNVRRYVTYLEQSIDAGTRWAVFEPNGPALWSAVRASIENFLYDEFRTGALQGSKPEEAFFVRCDATTMTQNDLDDGRLVCLVGVALLKPAEFVVFRLAQWMADSAANARRRGS